MPNCLPCVTYFRQREEDRRSNASAMEQQREAEARLTHLGYDIVARFGDPEFAAPFSGWMEPRSGFAQAIAEAGEIAASAGSCTIVILRADGIGQGDPFLPGNHAPFDKDVGVRVCGFSLRGHADTTSLRDARASFDRYKLCEDRRNSAPRELQLSNSPGAEIPLVRNARKRSVVAYYCNPSDGPVELEWHAYARPLFNHANWSVSGPVRLVNVAARSARYLATFVQGDPDAQAIRWRFKVGNGRARRTGNVVFSPSDLIRGELEISWYAHEPSALALTDFRWEDRPAIETARLRLRNWTPKDAVAFARVCNTASVMRYLGGVQTPEALDEDVEYFAHLGRAGPTYWVVERLADGALLGFCGILQVEEEGSPVTGEWEIGWRLGEQFWGQGYAFEAASEVMRCAFEEWDIDRLVCRVNGLNDASAKLVRRLGMKENPARAHRGDENETLLVFELGGLDFWRSGMTAAALD